VCHSEPMFSIYEDIEIGNQIPILVEDPSEADSSSDGYTTRVLSNKNWAWVDKPPNNRLPLHLNGKTPKIHFVEESSPPRLP
jgi:hypothetical protein